MQTKDDQPRKGTKSDPVVQAVQGNFDHLMGQIRAIANAHNLMVSDLEEIQGVLNGVTDDTAEIVASISQSGGGGGGGGAGGSDVFSFFGGF